MIRFIFLSLFCMTTMVVAQTNQPKYTISGYVTEKGSKENLPGVNIYFPKLKTGTTTNPYGFYSLTLPQDSIELLFSFVGYQPKQLKFFLDKNITHNIELGMAVDLEEVIISAEQQRKVSQEVQMSSIDIPIEQIKQIPALLGEKDVLKVIQLMPGVQKGSEGSSGFYVRGGGPDQNLIILDDATVYNANHLFGFFSVFNGDALKSIELTKGGFPARYGGRLSSVLDIQMKDGNKEKIHGEAGIGLISSRLTLEGPIIKDKCSFLVSARRTYIDALIYPFLPPNNKGGYFFYDLNAKLNYVISDKDRLYVSSYFGKDKFYIKTKSYDYSDKYNFNWGNATATVRWNHLFTDKLFANTSFIFTNYSLNLIGEYKYGSDFFNMSYKSGIRDLSLKSSFDFVPSPNHYVKFGLMATYHRFTPDAIVIKSSFSSDNFNRKKTFDSFENGIFIEDDWKISSKLRGNIGLRLSHFYADGANYFNPEPRASLRYLLKDDISIKASYATMNQYLHLLSNTGIGLPTDLWVPATAKTKPQQSKQLALGVAKDFTKHDVALTIEGYYKEMSNVLGYKEGSSFLAVGEPGSTEEVSWENNVTSGRGWSYGAEILLQKKIGRFSGWIGYTLSWTQLQFDSLNFGKKYYARYDRRHDISVVGIYKINDHITLSATWVYGTGNAITLPVSSYGSEAHHLQAPKEATSYFPYPQEMQYYGEQKNAFRMAAYHRMDVGIQFHKKLKRCERTFELSFYNIYNRQNPFFYFSKYDSVKQQNRLMQISLFPIIPSVSWTYKF